MTQKFVVLTPEERAEAVEYLSDPQAADVREAQANQAIEERLAGLSYCLERVAAVPDHPASVRLRAALRGLLDGKL